MKSKIIIINNDKDYNNFLRRIILYKSIFYCNTKFAVRNNINNEMLDYMIDALNIKNRRKRITYIYDTSCKLINNKNKDKNICGFKNNKCYIQQKLDDGKCNGCCRLCIYQSSNGCTTSNLSCKLFNCSEVTSRYDVIKSEDLKILQILSLKNQLIIKSDYFSKREDVLKDLYSLSLLYSTLRTIYRLIKNYFCFKKLDNK